MSNAINTHFTGRLHCCEKLMHLFLIWMMLRYGFQFNFWFQNDIKGKGCKLKEPVYGTEFDLNELHSEVGKTGKSVVDENDYIDFNVCGNDTKECGPEKIKAQACFKKGGKYYWFGE